MTITYAAAFLCSTVPAAYTQEHSDPPIQGVKSPQEPSRKITPAVTALFPKVNFQASSGRKLSGSTMNSLIKSHLLGTIYFTTVPPSWPHQPQEHCASSGGRAARVVALPACRGFPAHGARPKSHSEAPPALPSGSGKGSRGIGEASSALTRANSGHPP